MIEIRKNIIVEANVSVGDWRQAIRAAGKLLVKHGMTLPEYTDAMVKLVETKGPYIVLTQGLAMPHARPEDGAKKIGIGLLTLTEPIVFGHPQNDPVRVVAALSSVDSKSHLTLISYLAKILGSKDTLCSIIAAQSSQEIYAILERRCDV